MRCSGAVSPATARPRPDAQKISRPSDRARVGMKKTIGLHLVCLAAWLHDPMRNGPIHIIRILNKPPSHCFAYHVCSPFPEAMQESGAHLGERIVRFDDADKAVFLQSQEIGCACGQFNRRGR